ncbi:Glycosylation-dependent cell adhesion molecule 1 [Heterocephalus glaber]|uniref:Glycosylation-dependent cell adhesion molecule 1 n=1 Tax=Heterocephalus glaber TaxID=10181 RepID=G5BIC9_HETGA|nr:Glycosylation-dependent cell adhesion molecule 1 [Heterocephalus glaber]
MKVIALLLLASLAFTSLAILHAAQSVPTNHPRKDHVSNEDLSKEPSIIREELISKQNVEIKSTRPKNQKSMQPHPIFQEESLKNARLQSEESTEPTPRTATTSEGRMAKLSHKIENNLDKIMNRFSDNLKSLIPSAKDVMKP